jgi:hypothetical protein
MKGDNMTRYQRARDQHSRLWRKRRARLKKMRRERNMARNNRFKPGAILF